jgi:hypothetical protein
VYSLKGFEMTEVPMSTSSDLRNQALKLRAAADKLDQAASALEQLGAMGVSVTSPTGLSTVSVLPGSSRLEQLKEFVKETGPVTRKRIIAQSGLPVGTISSLLKEANGFKKTESGHWEVVVATEKENANG